MSKFLKETFSVQAIYFIQLLFSALTNLLSLIVHSNPFECSIADAPSNGPNVIFFGILFNAKTPFLIEIFLISKTLTGKVFDSNFDFKCRILLFKICDSVEQLEQYPS